MDLDALARRIPAATLIRDPEALGEYASDWSSGAILRAQRGDLALPAAVVRPASPEDVAAALSWAGAEGVAVIPSGGRSGVSGGTLCRGGELMLDLRSLDRVLGLDEISGVVHCEAGIMGTAIEAWLSERGYTLGHFPQSIALSTVGGWIAAKSAGQFSNGYGAIEDMLVAIRVALADGSLAATRPAPRSAAGIDMKSLFLGSEGTLGVVVEAWLRVRRAPATREMAALRFSSFGEGLSAARRMAQAGALPDALRVYDEGDTAIAFRSLDPVPTGCVGVLVVEGDAEEVRARVTRALGLAGAPRADQALAEHWWEHRNNAADSYRRILSGELLGPTAAADTIEV
ncbi:MAG: FAD-binding oxidoreductase, partial [Candidatus Dormibacteria bacterium]